MSSHIDELLNYIRGSKDILEGKCEGACVTNALLNLDAMEAIVKSLRDSPRERDGGNHSGDLEYHVETQAGELYVYGDIEDAGRAAFLAALVRGEADVDVVVWSEEGARAYGGDDAVEQYREDPEASVFERLEVRVNNQGRVP